MKSWSFKNTVREAQFAGQFYAEDIAVLENQLDEFFTTVSNEEKPDEKDNSANSILRALISPHAGYVFSGEVAASAFHQIPDDAIYERIFILASSHRFSFDGAAVYCEGNYKNPLGEINVDNHFCKQLVKQSPVFKNKIDAHIYEHSIEVQLPFLQHKIKSKINLVPIILGTQDPETCKKIAEELQPWFTSENLFIISTDFSHYPNYEDACNIDEKTADAVCSNNPEQLLAVLEQNKQLNIGNLATSLCGWTSVLTLLYLAQSSNLTFKKLKYLNSGDAKLYHDRKRVVGYWAIAVNEKNERFQITSDEKREMLTKAFNAIETYLKTGKKRDIEDPWSEGILNEKTGVFVSVYVNNELRGCIGSFASEKTLNHLIQKTAVSSVKDRRFNAIEPEDIKNMELEISVLSPMKKIESVNEIAMGKHGIYIHKNISSGTYLPQVAIKTGWSREEFLGHCARDKAGIGWDGWKTADIFIYEAAIVRGTR